MSEIRVSPINGENILLVNGFRIEIDVLLDSDGLDPVLVYPVQRKGVYIDTFTSLQDAVEWCRD